MNYYLKVIILVTYFTSNEFTYLIYDTQHSFYL